MLLGKRPRNPMKRTTSLSEITFDLNSEDGAAAPAHRPTNLTMTDGNGTRKGTASSPRHHRLASADFLETPSFLRSCSLCNRRLVPGRDIFMYRGDSAFCSSECRQQQMIMDERREVFYGVEEGAAGRSEPRLPRGETTVAAV